MKPTENNPPKLFVKFFRWFCHIDFQEEIEGDLFESYKKYAEQFGMEKQSGFLLKKYYFFLDRHLLEI